VRRFESVNSSIGFLTPIENAYCGEINAGQQPLPAELPFD